MENSLEIPQKSKIEIPYDPAILGSYLKEMRSLSGRYMCTPMFIAALFTVAKTWKLPKCSLMNDWIKKMGYIHILKTGSLLLYIYLKVTHTYTYICITHNTMKYYSAIKKEILPFVTKWVNLECIVLSEISQRQIMHDLKGRI